MRLHRVLALYLLTLCTTVYAGPYDQAIASGAQWLAAQNNLDGSWGSTQGIQPLYTSAAVRALALAAAYKQQNAYYAGITWLENNAINSVDLISRQTDALANHGDDLLANQNYLIAAQNPSAGWGLSAFYTSSTYDTALALIALADTGGSLAQIENGLNFLANNQLSGANNQGWSFYTSSSSDPATTALAIQALANYTWLFPSLQPIISSGLTTLNILVTSSSPPALQALAVQAVQAAQAAGNPTTISTNFLSLLVNSQNTTDGSWSEDPYSTALAIRALANAPGSASTATAIVAIPDQGLRLAINLALGHNAMDSITQGELLQLTSLNAEGDGISNLSGLQYATNLTSLNLNNNNLSSLSALSGLTGLAASAISWTGNPGNPGASTQVPALPQQSQLLLALGLIGIMAYFRRSSAYKGDF